MQSMLKRIVESGFASYNEKKGKYTLLGWSRVNNRLFDHKQFKKTKNITTGTELYRYYPLAIPNIKELELMRFAQLLVQLNQQFQYNHFSKRKTKSNNTPSTSKQFELCHQDHSLYEFEASVEYMRLKGGYSSKTEVHRLKMGLLRKGHIAIAPSVSIANLVPKQLNKAFLKYNPEGYKYKVIMNEVYKIGTDKIKLNLKRIFGTRTRTVKTVEAVFDRGTSTGKSKKELTERQTKFLANAEANKGALVHYEVLPPSFLYKKIGVNMINSIIQKSMENGYTDLMKWVSDSDVLKVKKKKSIVRYEEMYYGGWDKRKVFDTVYEDRFILKP